MSDTGKVFLACALGALVGSLIALQFGPHFWWVGAFAGGFVGYLVYDFPAVLVAIPKAYRDARGKDITEADWAAISDRLGSAYGLLKKALWSQAR